MIDGELGFLEPGTGHGGARGRESLKIDGTRVGFEDRGSMRYPDRRTGSIVGAFQPAIVEEMIRVLVAQARHQALVETRAVDS